MKTILNFFALAIVLVFAQMCRSKSEKETEAYANAPVENVVELTVAERREKVEAQRLAQAERRRIQFEERFKNAPYYTDSKGVIIYNKAEVDPSFVGGNTAMMKYLKDNLVFPKEAQDKGLEGTVFVDFIVMANGTVREVVVTDESDFDIDQSFRNEAIRVVTSMPKWAAGRQNGKAVDVNFSLPITFQLN